MSELKLCIFYQVKVGDIFKYNGTLYKKRSSRTAHLLEYIENKGDWFYFRENDPVRVQK